MTLNWELTWLLKSRFTLYRKDLRIAYPQVFLFSGITRLVRELNNLNYLPYKPA